MLRGMFSKSEHSIDQPVTMRSAFVVLGALAGTIFAHLPSEDDLQDLLKSELGKGKDTDDDDEVYPEDMVEEVDPEEDKLMGSSKIVWHQRFCDIACERTKDCRKSKYGSYCKKGQTRHDPDVCFGLYRKKGSKGEKHRRFCFEPTDKRCNDHKLTPVKCHIKPRFTKFGGIIAFEKFLLHQDRA
jgi:hypothetical protein